MATQGVIGRIPVINYSKLNTGFVIGQPDLYSVRCIVSLAGRRRNAIVYSSSGGLVRKRSACRAVRGLEI